MIYIVNVDIEIEAETKEIAEDRVLEVMFDLPPDFYSVIREVKELNA